jgi:hypothetical protein
VEPLYRRIGCTHAKLFHVEQFELTNSAIASYEMYRPSPVFIRVCEVLEGWAGVRGLRVGTTRRVSAITIVTHGTIVLTDTCVGEDLRRIAVTQVPENCTLLAAWGGSTHRGGADRADAGPPASAPTSIVRRWWELFCKTEGSFGSTGEDNASRGSRLLSRID